MAKLIISLDGQLINEIEIDKERITIGRKSSNDIPIDNLAVSGEHAAVITQDGQSFVEDLGSTNGTQVNNVAVQKHSLHHGDEIEIGKYRLKYVNLQEVGARKPSPEFEKTMILRRDSVAPPHGDISAHTIPLVVPPASPATESDKTQAVPVQSSAETTEPHAVIQILNGPNAGKELELTKTLTSLGKPGVQVAVITRRPHGFFVTHVQGEHYPSVNGQTLDAHPRQLADHDVIELGGVKMEFYLK